MLDSPTEAYPPVLPSEDEDGSSADEISGDDDDVIDDEIPTDNEDDIVDTSVKNLDDVPSGSLADGVAEGDDGISRDAINVDDNLAFDDVVPMHEVENEIGDSQEKIRVGAADEKYVEEVADNVEYEDDEDDGTTMDDNDDMDDDEDEDRDDEHVENNMVEDEVFAVSESADEPPPEHGSGK